MLRRVATISYTTAPLTDIHNDGLPVTHLMTFPLEARSWVDHISMFVSTSCGQYVYFIQNEYHCDRTLMFQFFVAIYGDPLRDIIVLQDHDKLNVILIKGRVHKSGRRVYLKDISGGFEIEYCSSDGGLPCAQGCHAKVLLMGQVIRYVVCLSSFATACR